MFTAFLLDIQRQRDIVEQQSGKVLLAVLLVLVHNGILSSLCDRQVETKQSTRSSAPV